MYRNILIATDGSELAGKGLAHGLDLAAGAGAAVTIVTVTEAWSALEMADEARQGHYDAIARFEAVANARAQKILDAAAAAASARGVKTVTVHVPDQKPAEAIIDTAKEKGCDLIVMASHGRRGVGRLLIGSQSMEVVSHSTIPTLIVR
ncbi:MAG: universal stress protein [Rhizobiaceae bacterium]